MSSLRFRCAVIAVPLAWAVPAARAQTVAGERARIAVLTTRLGALNAALDSVRRREDIVQVDGVRVIVKPEQRSHAEAVVHEALAQLERTLGAEDRRLLDGWLVTRWQMGMAASDDPQRDIAAIVRAAGDDRLNRIGGTRLRAWADWWRSSEEDLQGAYLDLVTSPAVAATHCLENDVRSCAAILGLDSVGDPWRDLFDAAGRRVLVARAWGYLRSPRAPGLADAARLFEECEDQRSDDACVALLHTATLIPNLISNRARRSVVDVARRLGGNGTFTRLVADTTAAVGTRMAAAAGVPLDSLIHVWHARVVAAHPTSTGARAVDGWVSFLVVIIAGGLAMRSTRWRLA
jgi:hypothetical protein